MTKQRAMIVKVQVALNGDPLMLIYNEEQDVLTQLLLTKPVRDAMGDDKKAYFRAVLQTDGTLVLGARAEEQDW